MKITSFAPLTICALTALLSVQSTLAQGVQIEKASGEHASPAASAHKPAPAPTPTVTQTEALYDHVQKYHLEVAKYQLAKRYIWTDRVLIEISDGPPPEPLASLLAAAPNNTSQFSAWVYDTFEKQLNAWKPGKKNPNPGKPGTDELIGDGGSHCFVNPIYLSYILARYPKANILIKGPTDPALFTVNGQLKAILSPWTQLPDGTPLL